MLYLLDTNMVSHIARKHPVAYEQFRQKSGFSISISVITEAEILAGLAKRPQATKLATTMHSFLARTTIYPWDSGVAQSYAALQVFLSGNGKALSAMDALIAAHAHAVGATLVTADKAFLQISDFVPVENWTLPQ